MSNFILDFFFRTKVKSRVLVRKISLLNLWLATSVTLFVFIFTLIIVDKPQNFKFAFAVSFMSFFTILLLSFTNLFLRLKIVAFLKEKKNSKRLFVLISFPINMALAFLIIGVYLTLNQQVITTTTAMYINIVVVLTNWLILMLHNFVEVNHLKTIADIENSKLKVANTEAANQILRQQIHPHFLFNALNILKSLYKLNPKGGEEYLIHLSSFLRASVSKHNTKIVKIKEELKLCYDYINIQRIRFDKALEYNFDIPEIIQEQGYVPSFSIQPLIENAIKHNYLTEEMPLSIKITTDGNRIIVSNCRQIKSLTEPSTGNGLSNLSERYRLLTGDDIIIREDNTTFSVSIKIINHGNSNN